MHMDSGLGELEAQLAIKEREWKELLASRDRQLESSLSQAQEECLFLRERYQKLREDFQFNLAILDERDRELERSDVLVARALSVDSDRQRELRRLRVLVLELEKQRDRDAEETQQQLADSRQQLDELQRSMAGNFQTQTEEYERMKLDLQCRIQEVEGELTLQRQETTAACTCKHHFDLKMDSMHAVVQSCELKLLSETQAHLQAQHQSKEALKVSEALCQQIQSQLHHKCHQMEDLTAVKDSKIKDLEDELMWMENKLKKEREDHVKKCEEAVQAQKECQAQLEAERQTHTQRLHEADKHMVKLQREAEVLVAQLDRIQKEQQEAMQQTGQTIHRLGKELEATQTGWDKYIRQVSKEMVVKDTEILSLHERETQLKTESERSREEMQRYKQQLSDGLKREMALEQMQVQLEVEWQTRCEDMKAQHYLSNEQLIQDLTQARDQARAELKERKQELQDLTVLLETERDQAAQGLTQKADSRLLKEILGLQQQNSVLRGVVTQMRKDMEGLIHLQPHHQAKPQVSSPQPGGRSLVKSGHASTLAKQEFSTEHTEAALANVMQQRGTRCMRRQQASGLMSGALLESDPPLLRSRLKQAASFIARLSREKQQLIEMGNRLRAQITTAGMQVEPERDSSTEKPREQQGRLFAVERLQYQLTTQELQYALMQRPGPLPGTNRPGPATEGPANPWCRDHRTRPESILHSLQDKEGLTQSQGPVDMELSACRLSSEGSLRSLKELWEILDGGLSPSIVSEGERELADFGDAGGQMTVFGSCAPIHGQPRKCPSKTPSNTIKTSRPGPTGRTCTIRNYNFKD
ncbi:coiled-coil domain-containing protein 57 isoform X2 [Pungitius pungitius]|uniref:coiled-coil domain-containing protein 57 isoform X2 n=1 Tax=Pungitius pungitius TaxID=134920 RepID=UPI002E112BB4